MYVRYDWFQVAAHFWSATAMALILVVASRSLRLDGFAALAFVVGLSAVGAFGWELVEYLGIFENLHFWGFEDSLIDLTADAIGVGLVLVLTELPRAFDRLVLTRPSPIEESPDREPDPSPDSGGVPQATADQSHLRSGSD
jgi:VanZ family protein